MIKVGLRAVWRVNVRGVERELDEMLIAVLGGLERTGKLGGATSDAKISYRHAYNLVKRWGEFLGAPLVVMRQGSGTKLTPLGERLLWAGRRVQSRLAPELEGLAGDFTRGLNDALGVRPGALAVHASHDFAITLLRDRLGASLALDLQSRGSFDALAALLRGDCAIAGFHVADGPLGRLMARRYAEGLAGRDVLLLALADRTQGLIVAKGNPKKVRTIADLAKPGVRFINRQRGSGTRALLEFLLTAASVERDAIQGYDQEEVTHSAVAALVAGRQADAGFGLEAAATRFSLGFVPIATERYYLAFTSASIEREDVRAFLQAAREPAFLEAVSQLPGYHPCLNGELQSADVLLAPVPEQGIATLP
jgi:putative molybdopterin biosynthesis protein